MPNPHILDTIEITSSYRYCWYPTVHRFPLGELLVTMRMTPDDIMPEGEFSAYCISRDNGRTWSRRHTIAAGANPDAAYTKSPRPDGSHLCLGGGYVVTESVPGDPKAVLVPLTKYTRAGLSIEQIRDTVIRTKDAPAMDKVSRYETRTKDASPLAEVPLVVPFGSIIDGLDGSLLSSMYYRPITTMQRTVIVARSTDEGKSWTEHATIAALTPGNPEWVGSEGCSEVDIVRLKDKRLYSIFRTGSGGILGHTWSKDDGRTWSDPVSMGIRGVDPRVVRLSNGMLALSTGRPGPVCVRFSPKGDGTDWSAPLDIFGGEDMREHGLNKRKSTRYTDLLEIEPGELIVVYDSVPYGWDPIPADDTTSKNSIMATFVKYD